MTSVAVIFLVVDMSSSRVVICHIVVLSVSCCTTVRFMNMHYAYLFEQDVSVSVLRSACPLSIL